MIRQILIFGIRAYQRIVGPVLRSFNGGWGHCRHQPTCSHYAIDALRLHGPIKGAWLAIRRLLRCHPWGTSGDDPVPTVYFWRRRQGAEAQDAAVVKEPTSGPARH